MVGKQSYFYCKKYEVHTLLFIDYYYHVFFAVYKQTNIKNYKAKYYKLSFQQTNPSRTKRPLTPSLLSPCRYGGAGFCPPPPRQHAGALRGRAGGQGRGGALALRQPVALPPPLLLPAAGRHGDLRQPGPGQAGAVAHHLLFYWPVRMSQSLAALCCTS